MTKEEEDFLSSITERRTTRGFGYAKLIFTYTSKWNGMVGVHVDKKTFTENKVYGLDNGEKLKDPRLDFRRKFFSMR